MKRFIMCLDQEDSILRIAEDYAKSTGATKWHGEIEQLNPGSTVIVFGRPSHFTQDHLRTFARRSADNIHVGIMTAKTDDGLKEFCLRSKEKLLSKSGNGKVITLAFNESGEDKKIGRHEIHYGDNAKIEWIANHEHYEVATICTHGRDDILFMADGGICGYDEHDTSNDDGELPACAFGPLCVSRRGRVPIKNLNVQILMVNSCLGFRLTPGVFGTKYVLGLSATTNPHMTNLVASDSIQAGHEYYNHLFAQCLMEGETVGAAVSELNNRIVKTGNDIARFNIIGDPDIRLSYADDATERLREPSQATTKSPIQLGEVSSLPSFTAATRRRVALDSLHATGLHTQRLQGLIRDASMQYLSLARFKHEAMVDAEIRSKVDSKIKTMNKTCKQIDQEVLSYLTDRTYKKNYFFPEVYQPLFDIANTQLVICPLCGKHADLISRKSYYCDSIRIQLNCPVCGIISDEPNEQTATTSIQLDRRFAIGDRIQGTLSVKGLSLEDLETSVVLVRGGQV